MLIVAAAVVTLVVGDFASTFFYHVPQHLWFTLHLRTHHDRRRSYWDHAVLSTRSRRYCSTASLGAVPYLVVAAAVWRLSWQGALAGPRARPAPRLVAPHDRARLEDAAPGCGPCCAPSESCSPRTTTAITETPISSLATSSASTTLRLGR